MSAKQNTMAWFPGQGAQHVGMSRELYDSFPLVKATFEEASDAISLNLKKLCFDGPDTELVKTENTQPALLTASVAAFRIAEAELGFAPTSAAGHSLGEYSALVAARAISLSLAVRWVRERGAAMQQAVPMGEGTMAAVLGLDDKNVEELCAAATRAARTARAEATAPLAGSEVECIVEPANFNAPGQVVIAGSSDAVALVKSIAAASEHWKSAKVLPLSVSAPFHCRLMKPARQRMDQLFQSSRGQILAPRFPYFPNRTARLNAEAGIIIELLSEQIDHPVLWRTTITAALESGTRNAVEFGPGKVLQGLAKRNTLPDGAAFSATGVSDLATFRLLEEKMK